MKLGEGTEPLSRLAPDVVVLMPTEATGDYCPIQRGGVTVGIVGANMSLSDLAEDGAIEVVRLLDCDPDGQRAPDLED